MLDPFDSLAVPSPEDLLGLRKLMGSNAKTVEYLAKLYNMETEAIRPTVEEWLAALPRIPPPSRQRSAPAEFFSPVALEMRLKAAAAASKRGPAQILEVNLPPPSAPVQGRGRAASGDRLQTQAAMRALNTKLNSRAIAAYSGRAPLADASLNQQQSNLGFKRKVLVGPTAPGSSTFLTAVPEDGGKRGGHRWGRGTLGAGVENNLWGEAGGDHPQFKRQSSRDEGPRALWHG